MRIQVLVRLKPGVLDVQGKAVEHALHNLGFGDSRDVRIGKLIELDIEASDDAEARDKASKMCDTLLVNSIIEQYEIVTG